MFSRRFATDNRDYLRATGREDREPEKYTDFEGMAIMLIVCEK